MSAFHIKPESVEFNNLLEKAFVERLAKHFVQVGIDAMRPQIEAAAQQVVEDLRPAVHTRLNEFKQEIVINVLLRPESKND